MKMCIGVYILSVHRYMFMSTCAYICIYIHIRVQKDSPKRLKSCFGKLSRV